jgi:hypothetical protein
MRALRSFSSWTYDAFFLPLLTAWMTRPCLTVPRDSSQIEWLPVGSAQALFFLFSHSYHICSEIQSFTERNYVISVMRPT